MKVRNLGMVAFGLMVLGFGLACSGMEGMGTGGACTAGTTKCEGDKLMTCGIDASWTEFACPAGKCGEISGVATCVPDALTPAAGDCTVGTTKCDGDKLQVCGAGNTWAEIECPNSKCGEVAGVSACLPEGGAVEGGEDEGGERTGKAGKGGKAKNR